MVLTGVKMEPRLQVKRGYPVHGRQQKYFYRKIETELLKIILKLQLTQDVYMYSLRVNFHV